MVGGYQDVDDSALTQLQNDENFNRAETLAREAFRAERNEELGELISVREQVVAGVNYKMTFESESGQKFQVVVFCQPWTGHFEVINIKPVH